MTRLLVDTQALLWWLRDDPALSPTARNAIADAANEPLVSLASLWEVAIKRSLGKLRAPQDLPRTIPEEGFEWLPISPAHAWHVRRLPFHHRDPFGRLLVAQALLDGLPLISGDPRFGEYGVDVWW